MRGSDAVDAARGDVACPLRMHGLATATPTGADAYVDTSASGARDADVRADGGGD